MYIISQQVTADGKLILNLAGKSSETKPTGGVVADGSTFLEENTDAFWKLDGTWKLEKAGQMKDLPVVDSGDNGKVMKVAEGAWAVGLDNGLPLSFPTEDIANANKFIGFDANGDYAAKDAPQAGDTLPSMTGNNGKVLGVTLDMNDDEQAEWVDKDNRFTVTFTDNQGTLECDKTISEILTAYQAGNVCDCVYEIESGVYIRGTLSIADPQENAAVFGSVVTNNVMACFTGYYNPMTELDSWAFTERTSVPEITANDIGKVLGVVSDGDGGVMLDWVTPQ